MEDEAGLGLAVQWIQQALVTAYEENCPFRPNGRKSEVDTGISVPQKRLDGSSIGAWLTSCTVGKSTKAQRGYRKEVRKASKETWRTFCGSINDLPRSARLHRTLSRGPKTKFGSLVAPTGEHTQSEGKPLDLLLVTHFPNSDVEGGVPAAARRATRMDSRVAARIIACRRAGWAISSFAPYKSPGMDGIFPALL